MFSHLVAPLPSRELLFEQPNTGAALPALGGDDASLYPSDAGAARANAQLLDAVCAVLLQHPKARDLPRPALTSPCSSSTQRRVISAARPTPP